MHDEYPEGAYLTATDSDIPYELQVDEQQQAALEDMRANGEGRDAALALSYWLGED